MKRVPEFNLAEFPVLIGGAILPAVPVFPSRFSPSDILVLAGAAGAGGMAPPFSTGIFARLKRVENDRQLTRERAC